MVVFSLTLVRHGETVANKDGVIQGHQDVGLSDTGLTQARLVAFRLRNDRFTHIFASDLTRAAQTAQIIAEASTVCQCSVIHQDPRLRERRFGSFEGKTFKELFAAAQKKNRKYSDFTPDGAETYQEVRFRAKGFFRELCEKMSALGLSVETAYIPTPVKDTQSTNVDLKSEHGIGFVTDTPDRLQGNEDAAGTQCTSSQDSGHPLSADEVVAAKRPRTEEPQLHRLSLEGVGPASDVDKDCAFDEVGGAGATTMARSNSSSSSGCSSLHDSVECAEADVDVPTPTEEEERDTDGSDAGVSQAKQVPSSSSGNVQSKADRPLEQNPTERTWRSLAGHSAINWLWDGLQPWVKDTDPSVVSGSATDPSVQTCPNVSLSPLLAHRLTSISSVSSGRNSSFDEADLIPSVVGEVLVVSHGGFIKELMTHFIEDLNCKIPGGKGHALRICPNTGVSRFMVTLGETDLPPTVTCLLIHDKEHLGTWQEPLVSNYHAIATESSSH